MRTRAASAARRPVRKGAIYDMVLEKGIVRIWSGRAARTPNASTGWKFRTSSSRTRWSSTGDDGSKMVVDFTHQDGKLTLSNPRGWECGDWAIFTTNPWIRQ